MAVFLLPSLVACSSPEEPAVSPTMEAGLYLNVATLGQSRTGAGSVFEKMQTLRVIVLHPDGKVEHNKHFSLTGDEQERKLVLLKVTPNEKKKIFLFANEESVASVEGVAAAEENSPLSLTDFFKSYAEGTAGFAEAVNGLYFAPDYSAGKAIPMSSMYEVEMGEGYKEVKDLYLVRVATKFTINFENWRRDAVTVKNFKISKYADKNFLMAHVNSYPNPEGKYPTWIHWLKAVTDASQADGYVAKDIDWLKDYALPSQANKEMTYTYTGGDITVGTPTVDVDNQENTKPGTADITPVVYLPESQNLKGSGPEQEYNITFSIDGREEPFSFTLPNLKALFRNTHVVVNITMYQNLDIQVDVIPYSEVTLDPIFGITPKETTNEE